MYTYGNITSQIHVNVSYPTKYDNGRIIYVIPMCCSCTSCSYFKMITTENQIRKRFNYSPIL